MEPAFTQLTVLAPGLLGASLAIGARQTGLAKRIHVWARRAEVRDKCAAQSWCDAVFDSPEKAVEGSDLVVICTPVETIHRLARRVVGNLARGAIMTDVGSTKGMVCRYCAADMPEGVSFIGSHPMAGSEKSGMEFASGDLFRGRSCFVTPLADSPGPATLKICAFWRTLGMDVVVLPPDEHDRIVANISHLPHFAATMICNWLSRQDPRWTAWAGQGLKDTTRVAAGSPEMWRAIAEQNKEEILDALAGLALEMTRMRNALENDRYGELHDLFAQGKAYRETLCHNRHCD
jgi:prephenate dehydrogenase